MIDILTARVWYGEEAKEKKLVDEIALSINYFNNLSANSEIYVVSADPREKGYLDGLFKLEKIPDIFEKIFSHRTNNVSNTLKLE